MLRGGGGRVVEGPNEVAVSRFPMSHDGFSGPNHCSLEGKTT